MPLTPIARAGSHLSRCRERNAIHGVEFLRIPVLHGKMEIVGFRFGRTAYLTDVSAIPEVELCAA